MQMRVESAAGRKLGDTQPGVDRSGLVVHKRRLTIALALPVIDGVGGERGRIEVPEVMH